MRTVLAGVLVLALSTTAGANGRPPYTSTINFQRGNDQHIMAGMTFGLVESTDGGATWRWMCENAIGYSGFWDPDYVYTASGRRLATTFTGMKVSTGCDFTTGPMGTTFITAVEQGPDGTVYMSAADPADVAIYKSTNEGMTFGTSTSPGQINDWWRSIVVAPGNASVAYLSGYRQPTGQPRQFLLFKSTNATTTFTFSAMTLNGIGTTSANSTIDFVGVAPDSTGGTPYIHVSFENGTNGDSIYKFNGTSWTKIYSTTSNFGLAFLARKDGTCIAATRDMGAFSSSACNTTWSPINGAPHIGCLYQDSAGVVYACTQNYAVPQLSLDSDGFGIMKSSNLTTWTGVLKYQDILEPLNCPSPSEQHDTCASPKDGNASQWCCLITQLGITSTAVDCTGPNECGAIVVDGPPGGGDNTQVKPPKGCCESGQAGPPMLLSVFVASAMQA